MKSISAVSPITLASWRLDVELAQLLRLRNVLLRAVTQAFLLWNCL